MSKIISISISNEDKQLLNDMELSPSGLFKQKMNEVRANSANYDTRLKKLQEVITQLQEQCQRLWKFVTERGLNDEMQSWLNSNKYEKDISRHDGEKWD